MPIVTCDDILAQSPSGGSVLEASRQRITTEDSSSVMPPGGLMPPESVEVLAAWLDDGAPPCR